MNTVAAFIGQSLLSECPLTPTLSPKTLAIDVSSEKAVNFANVSGEREHQTVQLQNSRQGLNAVAAHEFLDQVNLCIECQSLCVAYFTARCPRSQPVHQYPGLINDAPEPAAAFISPTDWPMQHHGRLLLRRQAGLYPSRLPMHRPPHAPVRRMAILNWPRQSKLTRIQAGESRG